MIKKKEEMFESLKAILEAKDELVKQYLESGKTIQKIPYNHNRS